MKDDDLDYELMFDEFWKAGMVKRAKPVAKKKFMKLVKSKNEPWTFVIMLIQDIKKRLYLEQYGFEGLHPATYLNQERWEDDYPQSKASQVFDINKELNDTSWADGVILPESNFEGNLIEADYTDETRNH